MSGTAVRELIEPGLIRLDLAAGGREEAIRLLADLMKEAGRVDDVEVVTGAALRREEQGSTNVGFGVAIPHCKSGAVRRPSLAFGRQMAGIPWPASGASEEGGEGDQERDRVRLVFLIAVPEKSNDEHLRILARLARALMDEGFRRGLREAGDAAELMTLLEERVAGD